MLTLFGFTILNREEQQQLRRSPVQPSHDDSAIELGLPFGGINRAAPNGDSAYKSENALINKYRDAAGSPIVDGAIEEITSEAIVNDDMEQQPVSLQFAKKSKIPANLQKILSEEFDNVLGLLDFRKKGHDIFRRWYIDGRVYFHKVIDEKNPQSGIQQLRYIDPRKIKKVREFQRDPKGPQDKFANLNSSYIEYWIYCDTGIDSGQQSFLSAVPAGMDVTPIANDSIASVTSGLWDPSGKMVISNLHKILRILNQYRMLEDAVVIYRLTRASEKRKFLIGVGNLPKAKAEAEMREMMQRFKNKLTYNSSTGEINEDKRFMALTEDYWFAVRDGEQNTDVQQFQGGANLGEVDDVEMFKQQLYRGLNVPVGRLDSSQSPTVDFSGQGTAISREELKFARFIQRLRTRFAVLFEDLLMTQVVLKGIATREEFDEFKSEIIFDYARDSYYAELKELEILTSKVQVIQQIDPFVGKYFPKSYIFEDVLKLNEDDIGDWEQEIAQDSIEQQQLALAMGGQQPQNGVMQESFDFDEHEEEPTKSTEQHVITESVESKPDMLTVAMANYINKLAAAKKKAS